ncbi:MAG: DEAD/DEAH box helicase [Gammaproteobacteria bacterium]|nr:DEAD/DEAH box helicase [Gammaproteobacteria bacterium]MCW8992713.1 DEAD/DEAH box helicase [Gammaproteobacteria bacterium]
MSIDPKKITAQRLREECGHGAYERGRGYFNQGRATLVEAIEESGGALRLLTTNRGRRGRLYDQEILLEQTRQGLAIEGFCDCPVSFNCKHVVAGCLAWKAQAAPVTAGGGDFEQWLAQLEAPASLPVEQTQEALLYLLAPASHRRGPEAVIELYFVIAKRKRNGEWGKGRRAILSTLSNHYTPPRYMQPVDSEIVTLLGAGHPYHWGDGIELKGSADRIALDLMVQSGRLYWGREKRLGRIRQGEPRPLALHWHKQKGKYRLELEREALGAMLSVTPPCYIDPDRLELGEVQPPAGLSTDKLQLLEQAPPVSAKKADRISRLLALHHPALPTPKKVPLEEVEAPPQPRLTLQFEPELPTTIMMVLDFLYADTPVDWSKQSATVTIERGKKLLRIRRDPQAENAARETLLATGVMPFLSEPDTYVFHSIASNRQVALGEWFRFSEEVLPQLERQGWRIERTEAAPFTLSHADELDAEIEESENDWFGLRFDLEVEGKKLPLLPLVSDLIGDYRPGELPETLYLDVGDGHYVAVPGARIEPVLQTIIDLYDRDSGDNPESLRLSRLDAPRLLELGETRVRGGENLQRMARRLRNFDGIKAVKPPTTFKGALRPYQQQGLDWLQFLREYELAGILADDMGLGKTVQALAHLAVEKRAGRMTRPSLIIAPTSLMGNWRREAAQFTPKLRVLVLHGPERGAHFDTLGDYDLVLTTYPLLPRDAEVLQEQSWHYLILDEAQQIKNPKSQAAQLVRQLEANHRLCLTGTPMENHLGELWAQFDFLLPGFLGDQKQFVQSYRTPIEKFGDNDKLKRLTQRTAPFMLRRTKSLVASELPEKTELLRTVPIEGKQAALYESIRLTMEKKVREAIAKKGLARSHITILDALLKLRQVCCDPRLLPKGTRGAKGAESAKLKMLMELLPEMLDEGRRILLFSQFTTMLGLIERELKALDIPYAKLTGQTRKREEAIAHFRDGEVNLFLISLKAGGVGLNLTEADTVIHYDPWWNPAVEAQATDRAHRIGQTNPVFVYKLITEGTVEEKILALQARKQQLADNIYGKGGKEQERSIDADTISALLASE